MKQIRLCWQISAVQEQRGANYQPVSCTGWESDTPENTLELQLLRDAANRIYGAGSHWTELRDVPGIRDWDPEPQASCAPSSTLRTSTRHRELRL